MNKPLKHIFSILVIVPLVLFSAYLLYGKNQNGDIQIFESFGTVLEASGEEEAPAADVMPGNPEAPVIKYNQGTHTVGSSTRFKAMFTVVTQNGTKNGTVEDDFSLYLSDVRNPADLSVVEFLTTGQIDALEEIPAAFLYDKEQDILHFHQSGIYTVMVNVYGADGSMAQYEFSIPVEAKE